MANLTPHPPYHFVTDSVDDFKARMQKDGNFVLYFRNLHAYWASNTNFGVVNPYLNLQNDGNLIVKTEGGTQELWASGQWGPCTI